MAKATKTRVWTIKFETTLGETKTWKFKAATAGAAVQALCEEYGLVANVLEVRDGSRVRWL